MKYIVTVDGRETEIEVTPGGVRMDGAEVEAEVRPIPGTDRWALRIGDRSYEVAAATPASGEWDLSIDGRAHRAEAIDERTHHIRSMTVAMAGAAGPKPVKAPMPGLVVRVDVEVGDAVQPGQGLVIVEAMKMENELKAEAEGVVSKIHVASGDTVDKDQVLIDFEVPDTDG